MSYTEEQLRTLLDQTYSMPYGPGQIALVEQVIAHADAQRLTRLAFEARMQATQAYVYGGERSRSFATFAWCLAEFDRDPGAYHHFQRTLLWHFKYMIGALTRFPEVPLERTYQVLDDMQRRWQETGHTMHAIYAYRHTVAAHIGDVDTAERHYVQWCAEPRDDLSDCVGCDPTSKAWWLAQRGRDEEAVALAEPVLSGRLTCSEQPQNMLATLMLPYLRTRRLEQARDAHRHAYRLHRPRLADLESIADHIEFCARTGNEARAVEIVERHLGWLDRAPSPWAATIFAAASSLALRRVQERDPGGQLTVHRPGHGDRTAARVAAGELSDALAAQATEVAGRFDRRNGTDRVGTLVRGIIEAQPWVEYLPLSPTRRVTTPWPRHDSSTMEAIFAKRVMAPAATATVEPITAPRPPEALPDTPGPDELLDLIEEHHDAGRDPQAAAALDAFEARYGHWELTFGQRARLGDAHAVRLANDRDHAGAVAAWRQAASNYAAAGRTEREHRALARAGGALCWSGQRDEGLPIVVAETDWLLANAEPADRVGAAVRLARCYLLASQPEDTLATLDRASASLDAAPPRARAWYLVVRAQALQRLQRIDEFLLLAPAAIEAIEAAELTKQAVWVHVVLAGARRDRGDPLGAAEHVAAAMALTTDAAVRAGLRHARADLLAGTERAGEVVDDLVEAVADYTAQGAVDKAADARGSLAVAYLNTGRLLDAAEVAEEELAYRLSVDQSSNETSSALPVRHLLATIHQGLGSSAEAVAQLDAIADVYANLGERAAVGQLAQDAGEILDKADRDDEAAARFLTAAEIYAELDQRLRELYNRRRHALSLNWAHRTGQAVAALQAADMVAARLTEDSAEAQWELARLHYDGARILWHAGQHAGAAARAGQSADALQALQAPGPASDARLHQARILLDDGDSPGAAAAARQALAELPDADRRRSCVEVLDAALRRQGRDGAADAVWAEYGLARPSTKDEGS